MAGFTIRQILFPTDFSDAARLAGTTAVDLAHQFGARLHVLHVVPPVTDPTPAPANLRAVAAELDRGLSPVTVITSGLPARQIVAYARKNAIDLLVMGTHGRTGVTRALLGSVSEAVVRQAPCRVLTVPASVAAPPAAEVGEIGAIERASCIVCGGPTRDELICETCRTKIRGEALERKLRDERAGR